MLKNNPFIYTGPLDPKQNFQACIQREQELEEVFSGIPKPTYYAVIGPRQIGKTTFLFQIIHQLKDRLPDYHGVYITLEDLVNIQHEKFYEDFCRKITHYLTSCYQIHPPSLKDSYKNVKTNLDLKDFLLELAHASFSPLQTDESIEFEADEDLDIKFVLLIDEIDALPGDIMIEFIKTIRSIFIERLSVPGFKSYSIVLAGSTDLATLTYGKTSPFNISKVIYPRDFSLSEISDWLSSISEYSGIELDKHSIELLFEQTQGHPYFTQLLCSRVFDRLQKEGQAKITQVFSDEIEQIISSRDVNLMTTIEKIKEDEILQEMCLKILKGEEIPYSKTHNIINNLELIGAIGKAGNLCKIRNPIYEKFLRQYFKP